MKNYNSFQMKNTIFRLFVLIVTTAFPPVEAYSQLVINELMQSNIDCIMDDQNDFPDSWVELYNPTDAAISLADYKIGTKIDKDNAWRLPNNVSVPAKGYQLIYCDKSYDKLVDDLNFKLAPTGGLSDPAKETLRLHTNFRLESGKGCVVYLFKGDELDEEASMADSLKKQPAPNIAYGRESDGSSKWGYELMPTPEGANMGGIVDNKQILGAPIFSDSGFVKTTVEPFELTLTKPKKTPEGAQIYFTTNGKEPTTADNLYTGPLKIDHTTVIRAKLFCDGYMSPISSTQSYIFLDHELKLPVISIVTNQHYLDNDVIGIFNDNNNGDGIRNNWRRPINLEYFEGENNKSILNQLCETRVAGAFSRTFSRKTMIIYANKRFGEKFFDHEFFPDQKPGLHKFKSLMLRNAGNDYDYLYMRDALTQRLMGTNIDMDWEAWSPAIVFVNGKYHAMLNIRERSEEDFIYTNYDGLEDIDLIENWEEDGVKAGDFKNWEAFDIYYRNNTGKSMADYEQRMDCGEFINLMLMNLFYSNLDFPGGNIITWRPRSEGGRWRWIAKDVDYALGYRGHGDLPYYFETLKWFYNPNYSDVYDWGNNETWTALFRNLMELQDFRNEFIERYAIYTGDFMNYEGMHRVWDPMYDKIKDELPYFCQAIGDMSLFYNYAAEMDYVDNWIKNRTNEFTSQLCEFYNLESPYFLTINTASESNVIDTLTFNDHRLSQGRYNGLYFRDHPINLKAVYSKYHVVTGWTITTINQDGVETTTLKGADLNWMMPACSRLSIEPICKLRGDFDNSNVVDQTDIDLMVSAVMRTKTDTTDYSEYDLNNDKKVDAADLVILVAIVNKKL